jgi:hypothetical protein
MHTSVWQWAACTAAAATECSEADSVYQSTIVCIIQLATVTAVNCSSVLTIHTTNPPNTCARSPSPGYVQAVVLQRNRSKVLACIPALAAGLWNFSSRHSNASHSLHALSNILHTTCCQAPQSTPWHIQQNLHPVHQTCRPHTICSLICN